MATFAFAIVYYVPLLYNQLEWHKLFGALVVILWTYYGALQIVVLRGAIIIVIIIIIAPDQLYNVYNGNI